jgi:hypothetical protein
MQPDEFFVDGFADHCPEADRIAWGILKNPPGNPVSTGSESKL